MVMNKAGFPPSRIKPNWLRSLMVSSGVVLSFTLAPIPLIHDASAQSTDAQSAPIQTAQAQLGKPTPKVAMPDDIIAKSNPSGIDAALFEEGRVGNKSIFARAWEGGIVVFLTLNMLVAMSILCWALILVKIIFLKKARTSCEGFVKSFWESRSLNDLNGRLTELPESPAKEVFRFGYTELVRGSQLRDNASNPMIGIRTAMDNLERTMVKARASERKKLERYLPLLATIASAAPFIGLFGTVWGIMGAFEGIAQSGSASLAAVAPGISEALIATAFGLAAAIPAVIGYNLANARIRKQMVFIDGFVADFMNIVGRYLVNDKSKSQPAASDSLM